MLFAYCSRFSHQWLKFLQFRGNCKSLQTTQYRGNAVTCPGPPADIVPPNLMFDAMHWVDCCILFLLPQNFFSCRSLFSPSCSCAFYKAILHTDSICVSCSYSYPSLPSILMVRSVGAGRVTQRWHGEADFGDGAVDEYYDHSPGSLRAEDPAHRKYGSPGSSRTEDQSRLGRSMSRPIPFSVVVFRFPSPPRRRVGVWDARIGRSRSQSSKLDSRRRREGVAECGEGMAPARAVRRRLGRRGVGGRAGRC